MCYVDLLIQKEAGLTYEFHHENLCTLFDLMYSFIHHKKWILSNVTASKEVTRIAIKLIPKELQILDCNWVVKFFLNELLEFADFLGIESLRKICKKHLDN